MDTITREDEGRLDAALDQLFAALGDVELGQPVQFGKPLVLLVTLKDKPGFAYFTLGFDTDSDVAKVLRSAAERIEARPPDMEAESTKGET